MSANAVRPPLGVRAAALAQVGAGMTVRRALPDPTLQAVGPVIFLDHAGPIPAPSGPDSGVPPHPHAGMETLTYLLSGTATHRDSAGGAGVVSAGGAQWMRAGRGVVHAESVAGDQTEADAPIHLVQLWINLPRGLKRSAPEYRAFAKAEMPSLMFGDASLRLIAGQIGDRRGPVKTFANPLVAHLVFEARGTAEIPVTATEAGLYVTSGELVMDGGAPLSAGNLVAFGPGALIRIAAERPACAMLIGGPALDAPIVRHGPFVMNTHAEIQEVLRDYLSGRMGSLSRQAA